MHQRWRAFVILIAVAAAGVLTAAPLVGWPTVVRLPAVLVPGLILASVVLHPWRWSNNTWQSFEEWAPSARAIGAGACVVGLLLFWLVLTRFRSGEINAVDFTVYFDRPCFQTVQGRPLFVETADFPAFSQRGALAHHAYWGLFPVCYLYALQATPLWLLTLSVVAVTAGAVHVLRTMQYVGASSVLAVVTALAFVLNDNTARALNYGFHPEVLYAWFIPWMLDAGVRRNRWQFVLATLAATAVKEDAVLPVFAASLALGLNRFRSMSGMDRIVFLVLPIAMALANLGIYYSVIVPALTTDGLPAYGTFWASYGPTPIPALVGMLSRPWDVVTDALKSGFFSMVILPHLFLPVLGWRWTLGILPTVAIYSASDDPQLRAFGIYYSIVLVPFLVIGASTGALVLAHRFAAYIGRPEVTAATLILLGALLVGSGNRGYSLRPWKSEISAMPDAVSRLAHERVVLVQSGLYPHAGYDDRIQLLTPETLQNPLNADAAILMVEKLGSYPFESDDLRSLRQLPPIRPMPEGLLAVRRPTLRYKCRSARSSSTSKIVVRAGGTSVKLQ